jgi:hypothetical protein
VSTLTTNYSLTKPTNDGDAGAWDDMLNADLDTIDTTMKAISDVANAALPKAGGTMTGSVLQFRETHAAVDLGSSLSGTVTINCALGNVFYGIATAAIVLAFSNVPSGYFEIVLELKGVNSSLNTVSYPASVKFPNATAPTLQATADRYYTFVFYTRDSGTTWRGGLALANMA